MKQIILSVLSFLLIFSHLLGQGEYCESPYFIVSENSKAGEFPLLSNKATVNITGPIADVSVTQSYTNNGELPIEAIYVFPASTRAAVYHMEMKIGDRVIVADIKEKQKARQTYEKAKSEGKRTSLLEQHRPNVFQMNVANIMPGDIIDVTMKYTEFIIPEDQIYTFVYPTVVGPRYSGEQAESFAGMPYTKQGEKPLYEFDLNANLNMSVPIRKVYSNSHNIKKTTSGGHATVSLKDKDSDEGNRDFILNFKLSGDEIMSGVQVYSSGKDNYFLCQVEPPSLDCEPVITPREYIFILDVSGSMSGEPLDVSKALMKNLFAGLSKNDKFNVMFFAGSSFMMHDKSVPATKENVKSAFNQFEDKSGGGGTNMLSAINRAMKTPKETNYSRSFVIVTDGYVTVEEKAFRTISQNLGNANFYAFGIGSGVNRFIIEGIAHVGRAEPFIVTDMKNAKKEANRLKKYIEYPMLTDIKFEATGVDLFDIIPEHIPDLMAARPIYFFGKYSDAFNGKITVTGNRGKENFKEVMVFPGHSNKENKALSYLWAREKIRYLDDFNTLRFTEERKEEITKLGLDHNLLTKYTSFVAVDNVVVNEDGKTKQVKQALPLPQGVSNSAVGFEMELEEMVLLEGEKVEKLDIETDIEDQLQKTIVESILEKWAATMAQNKLVKLAGSNIRIEIIDGKVVVHGSNESIGKLKEMIQTELEALGMLDTITEFELIIRKA